MTTRGRSGRFVALLFATCTLLPLGCGQDDEPTSRANPKIATIEGESPFPWQSLVDWKSYADHVVTFSVIAEHDQGLSEMARETGEGPIGRKLELQVDEILWSAEHAPVLPHGFQVQGLGWFFARGERREMWVRNGPRILPQRRYLAPVVHLEDLKLPWSPLAIEAQLPLAGNRVHPAEVRGGRNPILNELSGLTVDEIAAKLAKAEPDPLAFKHREKRPMDRVQAVDEDGGFSD